MAQTKEIIVSVKDTDVGLRLDVFISNLPEIDSRTLSQKIIKNDSVVHQQTKKVLKTAYTVKKNDILIVQIPLQQKETHLQPWNADIDIIFEDEHLAVINKASGIAVHPSIGHQKHTLVNLLLHHCHSLSMGFNEERPGIVHRIDLQTSGLLVIAKNNKSHAFLAEQFKNKTTHRKYWALVFGQAYPPQGSIISWLKRDPRNRKKFASITKNIKNSMAVVSNDSPLVTSLIQTDKEQSTLKNKKTNAKQAITHYKMLKEHACGVSLVECQLQTGRTHQIRVHMSEKGNSILGDTLYGRSNRWKSVADIPMQNLIKNLDRLALCAYELGFVHPVSKKELRFKIGVPENLKDLMKALEFCNLVE
ncbi:MAG: RluA family pseudouridine synthase [Bdellovibrionaceae bacterium]|nr:RluA family pseudouridine synthase [Pseudobdellovibrionaceae bacterium]